ADAREADSGLGAVKEVGDVKNYWAKKMGRTVPPPGLANLHLQLLAHFHGYLLVLRGLQFAMYHSGVELPRTRDLLLRVLDHFVPLRQPASGPRNGEQHGKHLRLEAHGLVNDPRVEVNVGIELAGDEVIVSQRDPFELQGNVEPGVASGHLENFVSDGLNDAGARIVVLVNPMPEAHQLKLACLDSLDVSRNVFHLADLVEHGQHRFVG